MRPEIRQKRAKTGIIHPLSGPWEEIRGQPSPVEHCTSPNQRMLLFSQPKRCGRCSKNLGIVWGHYGFWCRQWALLFLSRNNPLSCRSCDQVAVELFNPQRRRENLEPSWLCRGFSPLLQLLGRESHKLACILAGSHFSAEAIRLCRKGMQDLWGQGGRLSK